jgi:hypothetical protein
MGVIEVVNCLSSLEHSEWVLKIKVKVTVVQALRLCRDRTARRRSRGIVLPFHDHGTGRGWGVSVTPWPLFIPGKDPVPIIQEAGWAPGPVWTGAENLAPTGIRSSDRPARSQSLYWLRYPSVCLLASYTEQRCMSEFCLSSCVGGGLQQGHTECLKCRKKRDRIGLWLILPYTRITSTCEWVSEIITV